MLHLIRCLVAPWIELQETPWPFFFAELLAGSAQRVLRENADHPGGEAGATGASGSAGPFQHATVREVPAERESVGVGSGGDVRARRLDAEGQSNHGGALWPLVQCELDQRHQQRSTSNWRSSPRGEWTRSTRICVLDARYERVRENGTIHKRAVLVAIGINSDGRRCVLGVDLGNREISVAGKSSCSGFGLVGCRAWGWRTFASTSGRCLDHSFRCGGSNGIDLETSLEGEMFSIPPSFLRQAESARELC